MQMYWGIQHPVFMHRNQLDKLPVYGTIPSLTLAKIKNGYKPSNNKACSHFLLGNDLCYFFTSSVLVLFMMLRMADFEINS